MYNIDACPYRFDRILSIEVNPLISNLKPHPHSQSTSLRCLNTWRITNNCSKKCLPGCARSTRNQNPWQRTITLKGQMNLCCLSTYFAIEPRHITSFKTMDGWPKISSPVRTWDHYTVTFFSNTSILWRRNYAFSWPFCKHIQGSFWYQTGCSPSQSSIFSQILYFFGPGIYQGLIILAHVRTGFECKIGTGKVCIITSLISMTMRSDLIKNWLSEGMKTLEVDAVQKGLPPMEGRKAYNRFVLDQGLIARSECLSDDFCPLRFRVFYIACSELFKMDGGNQYVNLLVWLATVDHVHLRWGVGHYLFKAR